MPDRFKYFLQSIEWATVVALFGKLLFWIFTITASIHLAIGVACFLILGNLILGLTAMFKEGQKFEWPRFFWSISKFLLYPLALALGLSMESIIPVIPIAHLFAGWIVIHEGESIGKNFNRIYGFNIFRAVKEWVLSRNREWSEVRSEFQDKYMDPKSYPQKEAQDEGHRQD